MALFLLLYLRSLGPNKLLFQLQRTDRPTQWPVESRSTRLKKDIEGLKKKKTTSILTNRTNKKKIRCFFYYPFSIFTARKLTFLFSPGSVSVQKQIPDNQKISQFNASTLSLFPSAFSLSSPAFAFHSLSIQRDSKVLFLPSSSWLCRESTFSSIPLFLNLIAIQSKVARKYFK